ncbi:MAG: hypothetical protein FJ010_14685 [Chloroflexi bacterium]|nr:hypothetical protein [Chloroflexota bacterium]
MLENEQGKQRHFLLREAIALMQARQPREANAILAQYLRIHPNSEEGWLLLSYVVQEPGEKLDCLQRVLEINPKNHLAKERIEKLREVIPRVDEEQPKSRRFPIKAIIALVILVGLAILAGGVWGYRALVGPARSAVESPQEASLADAMATPTPETTFPANIFPTATPTPALTPSPTLPPSPTPPSLDESIAAEMDEIQTQVSELRGLITLLPVTRSLISLGAVRPILESAYLERHSRDEIADQVRALSTLGLVEPTYDLYTKTINQIGEGIGGFYIPWVDELYVIGDTFSGIERFVFAHEYTHALADQYYSLESIGVYPECLSDSDRCLAISALVEGDATYLMYQWLENYGAEEDINEIIAAQYTPLDRSVSSADLPPPYVVREIQFRYGDGAAFVDYLYQVGRWQMINLAYETLPQTTEQILHPEKYQMRESAKPVEIPELGDILGDGWRLLVSDALGELGAEMILGYGSDGLTRTDPDSAARAAAGWGGDHYQIFYKGTTNEVVLAAAWTWDTRTDADQFWAALDAYLDIRYRKSRIAHPDGSCWEKLYQGSCCIFRTGSNILWIISPDMDTLELIRSQYDLFR